MSLFFDRRGSNPKNTRGVVDEVLTDKGTYHVMWDNDSSNTYSEGDLIPWEK